MLCWKNNNDQPKTCRKRVKEIKIKLGLVKCPLNQQTFALDFSKLNGKKYLENTCQLFLLFLEVFYCSFVNGTMVHLKNIIKQKGLLEYI